MRYVKWAGGLLLMALMLTRPQAAALGAAQAMARWYATVAPSLFPFLALMPLLTGDAAAEVYERWLGKAMGALFDLPGAAAPAMVVGMVAGTPAGIIAARSAAARSNMNRGQLQRLSVAVTGFSPAFFIGGIGAGMLGSPETGIKLLAAQMLTQLTMAVALRRMWRGRVQPVPPPDRHEAEAPVRDAVLALLTICGYMALFGSVCAVISTYIGSDLSNPLLCLLDVPSGAILVAGAQIAEGYKLPLLAGMCGFGGMCLIAQSQGVLKDCGMGLAELAGLRLVAAGVSAGYMALIMKLSILKLSAAAVPGWIHAVRANPMAAAGLMASMLTVPALVKIKKSIS